MTPTDLFVVFVTVFFGLCIWEAVLQRLERKR